MKRISTIGTHPRERGRHAGVQLGPPYAERSETSLGVLCETKSIDNGEAQRRTGVNGDRAGYVLYQSGWYRRVIGPFFRER